MKRTGFRKQSFEHREAQTYADRFDGLPSGVESYALLNMVKRIHPILGLNGTDTDVLEMLFLFSRKQDWNKNTRPVVWPSNDILAQRLKKSITTISKCLTKLIKKGIITATDSPNGKRYGSRAPGGQGCIIEAYGFDLSPMAVRYEDFVELDIIQNNNYIALKTVKKKITICRKMIKMTIAAASEAKMGGDWSQFDYDASKKAVCLTSAVAILDELKSMTELVISHYDFELERLKTISKHSKNDNHIQNTTELSISICNTEVYKGNCSNDQSFKYLKIAKRNLIGRQKNGLNLQPNQIKKASKPIKVMNDLFVRACPQFHEFVIEESLRGKLATADIIRKSLHINDSAWRNAYQNMGTEETIVAIGIMLERQDSINSFGGYLRTLTERAQVGELNLMGSLIGLVH